MWGLDAAAPDVAVAAMQAMNASVRNMVFFPAFFGTPIIVFLAAVFYMRRDGWAAIWLFGAALLIAVSVVLTMRVNVPMNEALALERPETLEAATRIWAEFSPVWQNWNQVRTALCGVALLMIGAAFYRLQPLGSQAETVALASSRIR